MDLIKEKIAEAGSVGLFIKHILRKVFLEDWLIKLVALGVTLALWVGVTGLSTPTREQIPAVPITLRTAEDFVVSNTPLETASIVVSGDKRRLGQIDRSALRFYLDLTGLGPGEHVVDLLPQADALDLPSGVKVEEISPAYVPVRLEAVQERAVSVAIETRGELPEGFEEYSRAVVPTNVRVRGPESAVRSLESVSTERIDIAGSQTDVVVRQVRLNVASAKINLLDPYVDVTIRIGEKRMERIFLVPIADESGRRATVVLFGPRTPLLQVEPSDLNVTLETSENGETSLKLTLPRNLEGKVEIRKLAL